MPHFAYDINRLWNYSGIRKRNRYTKQSMIIMHYHVIEKGLTMPERRFTFGTGVVSELISLINDFEKEYGYEDKQVGHAVGVIKLYWELHKENNKIEEDSEFWRTLYDFISKHEHVPVAYQIHTTKEEFYKNASMPFPSFAESRHTLRHYSDKPLSIERIKKAVEIATTTPTACNRQYCRVHCITDKKVIAKVLELQGGNRGFGQFANKLLIVTSDIESISEVREHNDIYTNGGMFLMNLCYSLFYCKIAHCILNWSKTPAEDIAMRRLVPIKGSETVIAMLTCGEAPETFDICSSPKRTLEEIFTVH